MYYSYGYACKSLGERNKLIAFLVDQGIDVYPSRSYEKFTTQPSSLNRYQRELGIRYYPSEEKADLISKSYAASADYVFPNADAFIASFEAIDKERKEIKSEDEIYKHYLLGSDGYDTIMTDVSDLRELKILIYKMLTEEALIVSEKDCESYILHDDITDVLYGADDLLNSSEGLYDDNDIIPGKVWISITFDTENRYISLQVHRALSANGLKKHPNVCFTKYMNAFIEHFAQYVRILEKSCHTITNNDRTFELDVFKSLSKFDITIDDGYNIDEFTWNQLKQLHEIMTA